MMRSSRFKKKHRRSGVVLIIVLACIAVIALLLSGMMKASTQWSRQTRYETWKSQADCLAESGLRRAAAQLVDDKDYSGETWELTESDGLSWPATVEIKITNSPKKSIEVEVAYAKGSGRMVRSTRQLALKPAENQND